MFLKLYDILCNKIKQNKYIQVWCIFNSRRKKLTLYLLLFLLWNSNRLMMTSSQALDKKDYAFASLIIIPIICL